MDCEQSATAKGETSKGHSYIQSNHYESTDHSEMSRDRASSEALKKAELPPVMAIY